MQDVNHQLFSDSVWESAGWLWKGLSDQRIQEVLDRLHLLAFREKHPMSLSGGQKQRLAVATAMLSQRRCWYSTKPPVVWTMQECRKWPGAHGNWRTRAGGSGGDT
ncbi:MAG: ATP-binding cassette domain-containing protein [Dysosmobacter welbionis]